MKDKMKQYMMNLADWHLFVMLRFSKDRIDSVSADKQLKIFCREVSKRFGLKISSIGVINQHLSFTHCHLLMYGVNQFDDTLLEVSQNDIKSLWAYKSDIRKIYDLDNVVGYIVDKNMNGEYQLFEYGLKHIV